LPDTFKLSKDDGYDKKLNGKSLFASDRYYASITALGPTINIVIKENKKLVMFLTDA